MPLMALIKLADSSLVKIGNYTADNPVAAGFQLMEIENVTVDSHSSAYPTSAVTRGVVAGKWRITTTITDQAGQELADSKAAVVSNADRALAAGLKDAFNAIFFLVNDVRSRHGQGALTLAQFKTAVDALNSIDQTAFNAWLQGKI